MPWQHFQLLSRACGIKSSEMKLVVFLTCLLATAGCLARTQPPRQRKEDFFARDRHRLANNRIHPLESSISSPAKDFVFYEPCTPLKKPFIIFGVVFPAIFAYFQFISLLFIPCLTTTVTSMTTITTTTTAINVGRRRMKLNQIEWEGDLTQFLCWFNFLKNYLRSLEPPRGCRFRFRVIRRWNRAI